MRKLLVVDRDRRDWRCRSSRSSRRPPAGAARQGAARPGPGQGGGGGGGGRGGTLGPVNALGQEVKRPPVPTGPAPRLPDGTIDLNGLWNGGGPVGTIAQGLKQGETLPLLPRRRR